MPFKSSCLCECDVAVEGATREDVGVRLMEHMDEAHGIPVDPVEVSEFAIETQPTLFA
jgi:hypothetical protein